MKNVTTTISGDFLIVKISLKEPKTPSASGKSEVLASTQGNIEVPGVPGLKLGLNCYTAK